MVADKVTLIIGLAAPFSLSLCHTHTPHAHPYHSGSVGSNPSSATQKHYDLGWVTLFLGTSDSSLMKQWSHCLPLSITVGLNKSLTQHVAHMAVVTHLFGKVLYSWCPLREPEMPYWGILNISALSWQSVWYRISWPSHLAYSSVLSHEMMGNRPEKPWGKSTAEVGFRFSFYRLYDNA